MSTFSFGFLDNKNAFKFEGGAVTPVDEFDENKAWIEKYRHRDGFLYPALTHQVAGDERISNTERPQHLHRLKTSHVLDLDRELAADGERRTYPSYIIELLGFLSGTWLRFEDWYFDARVPLDSRHSLQASLKTTEHFLSHAAKRWHEWRDNEISRQRFTNLVYMFNRAPSYEWDWERFTIEYMVADACYKTALELHQVAKASEHKYRFASLCRGLQIESKPELFEQFVDLRNNLLHESLWDGSTPGTAVSGEAYFAPMHLRRFNQRLILGILGYRNSFIRTPWSVFGHFHFSTPENHE